MYPEEKANRAGETLGLIPPPPAMTAREKTWDECGIEEKVERLRQQLRMARDMSQYVARTAGEAKDVAERHQHGPNGEILLPLQRHGGVIEGSGKSFDPLR